MNKPYKCSRGKQIANVFNASQTVKTFADVGEVMCVWKRDEYLADCEKAKCQGLTPMHVMAFWCLKNDQPSADNPTSVTIEAVKKYNKKKSEFDKAMETYFPQFEAPQAKAAKIDKPEAIKLDMTQVENVELRQQVAALQAENMRLVCENHRLRGAK